MTEPRLNRTSPPRRSRPPRAERGMLDAMPPDTARKVAPLPWGRRIVFALGIVIALVGTALVLTPWQQSVTATGQVAPYRVEDRPQSVDAPFSGRIVAWHVQEGAIVRAGQRLVTLEDLDPRYLDPGRVAFVRGRLEAQVRRQQELDARIERLQRQIAELEASRTAQLANATVRKEQASRRESIARQSITIAGNNLDARRKLSRAQARQRVLQAQGRLEQARQDALAAKAAFEIEQERRERIRRLFVAGARSEQDDDFAERELVARRTALEKANQAVQIATQEVEFAQTAESQVDVEVLNATASLLQTRQQRDVAVRDIEAALNDQDRIAADTGNAVALAEGNLRQALADRNGLDDTIQALRLELGNISQRSRQQVVSARTAGRVSRIGKAVGPGQTVKANDPLVEIVPQSAAQAVELVVDGVDAPLVTIGRPVRLQFNGWPAVQIVGWNRAAYGTFAGKIATIDPIDNGRGDLRVWVVPDETAIQSGQEQAWPAPAVLRPGNKAAAWVLLRRVPLWYELWRQFNAFPPSPADDDPAVALDKKYGSAKGDAGKGKDGEAAKGPGVKVPKR